MAHVRWPRSLPLRLHLSRSCGSYGLALACPARVFDSETTRFVPASLGTTAGTACCSFDLHGPDWITLAIEQPGDVLWDFADVFSKSKTDFGSCSLMPFETSIPHDSAPVTSRPHRINHILAREVNAALNQYLTAGLIQHSTSPCSSPLVVIPKKYGGVRVTVNYNKLNHIISLSQLSIPRVGQVLNSFGEGRDTLFDLVSSFHQSAAHNDAVPLTAFCTPTGLYERLFMPQGRSASYGWFVKDINEGIKGLEQVVAYLDDVLVFDSDRTAHAKTIHALFERLRKHSLKLSPSKASLGATDADFLGHSLTLAGVRPNAEKVSVFIKVSMPRDLKQVRALLGGVEYYRKFLGDLFKRIRPITSLLTQ